MINIGEELAVQSYCYRGTKQDERLIKRVKECGLSKIELCSVHVDFKNEDSFDKIIKLYQSHGVEIVSIGMVRFSNDEVTERKLFEFVNRAGAKFMTVDFTPDSVPESYRTAERLAEEYDVRLGIHNHGGRHWLGNSQILSHVFANTSDRVGLCLDTAWALHSHEDPIAIPEKFAHRLYLLHIKDFIFDRSGKHQDVVVGTGNLDLKALYATLRKCDFNGPAILEYEGDVENPVPALKECVAAIREQMQG
jgi:inosose dehydratase